MDTFIFIALIVSIVIVLSLRIYFRQRQVRKDREEHSAGMPFDDNGAAGSDSAEQVAVADVKMRDVEDKPLDMSTGQGETLAVISHVGKTYGDKTVVNDVSFELRRGEVLGLVGPNGAGKTTTIRMLMDIVKPDTGGISIFGRPLDRDAKNSIGYLPEERGLYRKMRVYDTLIYLASLKDVPSSVARERAETLLKEVNMFPHKDKKVSELSRGMGQIIQFLVTLSHDPDLLVLDEPFAGLDPVNRLVLKDMILDLKAQGKSIILSTHMMNEVEEMCDRVLMINRGQVVLYGTLSEIKWRFRNNSIFVECDGDIGDIRGVSFARSHGNRMEIFLESDANPRDILAQLIERCNRIDRFEVSTPSLNEIFLHVVKQ